MMHYEPAILPDDGRRKAYSDLYRRVYKSVYPSLRQLYRKLEAITEQSQV